MILSLMLGHHLQSCEGPLVSDEDLQFFFITAPPFGVLNVTDPTPGAPLLSIEFNQQLHANLPWHPSITPPPLIPHHPLHPPPYTITIPIPILSPIPIPSLIPHLSSLIPYLPSLDYWQN